MFDTSMTQDELARLHRATVLDETGDTVGSVGQVYLDDQSDSPTWTTVKTGLFGTRETFVPLQGASMEGDDIRVPYSKDFIKDAPNVDADGHITPAEEEELYRYYRLQAAGGRHDYRDEAAVGGAGVGAVGLATDDHLRDADRARLADEEQATSPARSGPTSPTTVATSRVTGTPTAP